MGGGERKQINRSLQARFDVERRGRCDACVGKSTAYFTRQCRASQKLDVHLMDGYTRLRPNQILYTIHRFICAMSLPAAAAVPSHLARSSRPIEYRFVLSTSSIVEIITVLSCLRVISNSIARTIAALSGLLPSMDLRTIWSICSFVISFCIFDALRTEPCTCVLPFLKTDRRYQSSCKFP